MKRYFKKLIGRFAKTKILVIGDLMVDRFIRGKVSRISPEAPVPVVQVREETHVPGGSGNVIMNLAALGAQVTCLGIVGDDSYGHNLLEYFQRFGVQTEGIKRDPSRTTTIKTRVIAEHQQVVRFDQETDHPISNDLTKAIEKSLAERIPESNGVILSDYGKGMITRPLLARAIFYSKKYKKPICIDPKLEHFLFYKNVTCITPNLSEAMGGMHRVRLNGKEGVIKLGKEILKALKCQSVLITQGEEGMTLFEKKKVAHIPAKAREVYDVTGAGDTVIGVLTLSLACGATLTQAATLANLAAGIVVGKLGTATVTPAELKEALSLL